MKDILQSKNLWFNAKINIKRGIDVAKWVHEGKYWPSKRGKVFFFFLGGGDVFQMDTYVL